MQTRERFVRMVRPESISITKVGIVCLSAVQIAGFALEIDRSKKCCIMGSLDGVIPDVGELDESSGIARCF